MEVPAPTSRQRTPESRISPDLQYLLRPKTTATRKLLRFWRHDLAWLLCLVAFAGGIRFWLISHTEVAARDSIGFIRQALEVEHLSWGDAIRRSQQHPGYPLALLSVSWPVRSILGMTPFALQLSAQLASALASLLLVIPMFYIGKDLFDRTVAFWSTALFQCLPLTGRAFSDGLSESTFMLFVSLSLFFAIRGLTQGSVKRFALAGFFGGLAYLTRPEGALVVFATLVVLCGLQFSILRRRPWPRVAAYSAALVITAGVVGSVYFVPVGHFTNKPTPKQVLEKMLNTSHDAPHRRVAVATTTHRSRLTTHSPLPYLFAVNAPPGLKHRSMWGVQAIIREVLQAYQYFLGIPILFGVFWFRDRLRVVPGSWVILVLCVLHAILLWRLAVVMGYVSERHVILLVFGGIFTGVAAVGRIGLLVERAIHRLQTGRRYDGWAKPVSCCAFSIVFMAAFCGMGLAETLKPLHANRAGHKDAGIWLAKHATSSDTVKDPFCWAHFYAGRLFAEWQSPAPSHTHGIKYVVVERSTHEHNRLPGVDSDDTCLAQGGKLVYHWPETRPEGDAKVLVYAIPAPK
jgi:4-amino-4-deoxy-L-arabinose transferase-like glycosyltransferase